MASTRRALLIAATAAALAGQAAAAPAPSVLPAT